MKKKENFIVVCLLLVSWIARGQEDGWGYLKTNFAAPSNHYGSAPLWVWNTKVTKGDIDSMLYGFKKNAFGGVFVHPRPGLITEYLSQEWFDDYAYTVRKGKELGLDVWIYDENSYPSGFAGGHVPEEMPASYNQGQMLHLTRVAVLPEAMDKYVYCLKEEDGRFTDITDRWKDYTGRTGSYYLFNKEYYYRSPWFGGYSYVDLLVKGVTEKFIDVTMSGYAKNIGAEFGKTVRGVFSDEANIETQGKGNIRWTPDLFTTFRQKWGYDLLLHLPSLFEETGDWRKVRHDYFYTLLEMFVDRWSKPFATYAAGKNLEWTGHYWEHAWPDPSNGPDNMAMYVWPQRPGIDMLFNQFNEVSPGAQFGNVRSVKELASVCNQMGKRRNLSETYGGGGWDLSFKDMKRLGDWEFVLGVNTLNQHLADMTIAGARKYDYPQSFSYHTPWWPYYKSLNEHFTRLTFVLTRGEEKNSILVLEPTTSAWMYYAHEKSNERFREIGKEFQTFVTRLQKAQVEYDLGSEYIIKEKGRAENGKFIVGKRAYSEVVIPPDMVNVDGRTLELLKQFAAQGGKIVQLEKLQYIDGAAGQGLEGFNANMRGIEGVEESLAKGDVSITGIGGDLFHQRRRLKDGQVLFLVNSDMTTAANAQVSIAGKKVLLLNTFTGEISTYPSKVNGERVSFTCDLPPAGSMLLFVPEGETGEFPAFAAGGEEKGLQGTVTKVVRPAENTLMIDFCDVHIGDTVLKDKHVYYAADTVFKHFGFGDGNPWNTSVQFKRNIVDRDTFSRGSGFSVTYHFTVDGKLDTKAVRAIVERAASWRIVINGQAVKPEEGKWWLDKSFGVVKIGGYVRPGENTLTLSTDRMSIYDEVEPVYILGDFNLVSADKGWTLSPSAPLEIGSWKTQGLPMYGQGVRYVKEVRLDSRPGKVKVRLGKWNGTVAAVSVNGRPAGVIAYDPFELDISKYVIAGKNEIEVTVIGSLKNLLGPHHNSPKPGIASPWHWRGIRGYPSGKDYDVYDYGLMEDFQLITVK
ncbi:MAG: hypothetical protein J0H74_10030 [Chitinophagaceae bacterium]|nr:hypothetical protein [Chitinophagaceae bacterium]